MEHLLLRANALFSIIFSNTLFFERRQKALLWSKGLEQISYDTTNKKCHKHVTNAPKGIGLA